MKRISRRIANNFGYIGFGNNQNVFNQKSAIPFSDLKDKLHRTTLDHHQLDFHHHSLSKAEKETIKQKIRKEAKLQNRKIFAVFTILLIGVLYFIKTLIDSLMSNI
ncbi:hypothetical protein [Aestuariibaculum suncheonense]|uniref:Uncharacterized protein n=1 Tax=Aestuariibaculum suncheonense TaxID=1028745 RepID=A0A8J6UAE7_9FLAO|nr:hypothetical protein [Aestuariibaculum suncheonense]MBD0835183.1 hypothetical protein [Aestuariibaculum suncheonense]